MNGFYKVIWLAIVYQVREVLSNTLRVFYNWNLIVPNFDCNPALTQDYTLDIVENKLRLKYEPQCLV